MSPEEIATAAEKRLAEIEAEAVKLRAVIAAARGVAPAPIAPTIVPMPYPVPYVPSIDFPFAPVITCHNNTGGEAWHSGTAGNHSQVYRS
jgi:hypothetical protein